MSGANLVRVGKSGEGERLLRNRIFSSPDSYVSHRQKVAALNQSMQLHINKDTQLCISLAARPGNFGTRFHNFLFRELGLNFIYKAFTTRDIGSAIRGVRALGIRGCAISMPFKEACIEYLDELDRSAKRIMSVNTIVNTDGYLKAYNTDYTAVSKLIRSSGIPSSAGFALLGSGGMAKAVACALRDAGFSNGLIVARNEATGPALAHQYGFRWKRELTGEKPRITDQCDSGWYGRGVPKPISSLFRRNWFAQLSLYSMWLLFPRRRRSFD